MSADPRALGDRDDEPVGAVLAKMRRARKLTGAQLAELVGMSQPKISRIERGRGQPEPGDVAALARALGADDAQVQALIERAELAYDRMTEWRPASAGLLGRQRTMGDWEAAATAVRSFDNVLLPGLLQTSDYASVVFRLLQGVALPDDEEITEAAVLSAVSARVRRQEALAQPGKSFRFVFLESVLTSRLSPPAVMLAQIGHIRGVVARNTAVSLGIIPDGAPTGIPAMHGFYLLDDSLVVVDVINTGLISRSRRDVDSYRRTFDIFDEHAVEPAPILDRCEELCLERLRR